MATAQELLHDLRNKPPKDKLELQFIDFNESTANCGKLHHEMLASELFGGYGSSSAEDDENCGGWHAESRSLGSARSPLGTRTSMRTIWRWREKVEGVVALKQLDRDTLFIAYDNQVGIKKRYFKSLCRF